MARALLVRDARKALENVDIAGFAKEMGITISDAEAVNAFVQEPEVPEDSFVFLDLTIIDGQKMAAGNVRL